MLKNSPPSEKPHIWLFQDGEPLPIDSHAHLLRTGLLAERLVQEGFKVTWWTSRFDHSRKVYRDQPIGKCHLAKDYCIYLLEGPPYKKNLSLKRIRHYRACASHFQRSSQTMKKPDIILASYPSPELCHEASKYAKKMNVPCIVDVRDPWPAIFPDYFSPLVRWAIYPLCWHYESKFRAIVSNATGIVAVSKSMLDWASKFNSKGRENGLSEVLYIGYNSPPLEIPIQLPNTFTEKTPLLCLFVSSCGKSYDGFTLIEAARLLKEKGERRIKFLITNEGERKEEWTKRAKDIENITFTGHLSHSELQSILLEAHVGLILLEGGITRFWLGNKIFEYLATSLALINNVPGETAEIVNRFKVGINIKPKNPLMLVQALENLLSDPSLIKNYMENSQKAFREHFERSKIYDTYVTYLKEYLNSSHES